MNTKLNEIPITRTALLSLGSQAMAGAQSLGAAINLLQNSAAQVTADYRALAGDPGAPAGSPAIGAVGELNASVAASALARQALQATLKDSRAFCTAAIGLLKNSLGAKLNSRWRAAGFTLTTLQVPNDPQNLLVDLRAYYRLNPAKESQDQQVTATRADTLLTQLQDRRRVANERRAEEKVARRECKDAQTALRRRLTGLRNELTQLLPKDDPRWYEFGFKRPIDGRVPGLVTGLEVQRGLPHEVLAKWDAVPLAVNYRVRWRPELPNAPMTEVGLFPTLEAPIRGLTSGMSIVVTVTARNNSGESGPTETTVVVP